MNTKPLVTQNVLISTAETARLAYFLKLLIDRNLACMLVGSSGCGKGAIFRELFSKYASAQELLEIAVTAVSDSQQQQQQQQTTSTTMATIAQSGGSIGGIARAGSGAGTGNVSACRKSSSSTPLLTTVQATHFNFYTTSEIFQKMLDRPLEKKSGRCYAPSGPKRRLIYFVNDLNMPEVDAYGTVQPHTIMRQFMDYRQW